MNTTTLHKNRNWRARNEKRIKQLRSGEVRDTPPIRIAFVRINF